MRLYKISRRLNSQIKKRRQRSRGKVKVSSARPAWFFQCSAPPTVSWRNIADREKSGRRITIYFFLYYSMLKQVQTAERKCNNRCWKHSACVESESCDMTSSDDFFSVCVQRGFCLRHFGGSPSRNYSISMLSNFFFFFVSRRCTYKINGLHSKRYFLT